MVTFAYTDRKNVLPGILTKGEPREKQSHVLLPTVEHREGRGRRSVSSWSQEWKQQANSKGNIRPLAASLHALGCVRKCVLTLCVFFLSHQKLRLCHVPSGEALPLDHTLERWITKEECPLYNGGNVILEYLNEEEQFVKDVDSYLE